MLTVNPVILQAWINERLAPDLLEPKIEIVECIMEQIQEMEENIRKAPKKDVKVNIVTSILHTYCI